MNERQKLLKSAFPGIEADAIVKVTESAQYIQAPKGAEIFNIGDRCENFFLVIDGSVCVQLVAVTGRKIVLYHVRGGDICILTTACLIGGLNYNAEAFAESDVKAFALPHAKFQEIFENYESFRRLVFALFAARLTDIVSVLENVAFKSVDARLAEFLLNLKDNGAGAQITHSEIAANIGTAREVITRHLKTFVENDIISLHDGNVKIRDIEALTKISKGQ